MQSHNTADESEQHEVTPKSNKSRVQQTQHYKKLPIALRRSAALKEFWEELRKVNALYSIRSTHIGNVLDGADTSKDLFRVGCSLNDKRVCGIPGGFDQILSYTLEEDRESKFPRQQLCEYLEITEQQHKEIDAYGYRRNVFLVLLTLFESAHASDRSAKFQVPHILLLEELVTTLNGGCILGCPYVELASAAREDIKDIENEELYPCRPLPKILSNVSVTCTSPNRITVYASVGLLPWLGIGTETSLSYDVTVVDDKYIAYHNVCATVLLHGTDKKLSKKQYAEFCINPETGYSLQQDPPSVFPEKEGLILNASLPGGAFTAKSMLSSVPERVTLTDEQLVVDTPTPQPRSFWGRIIDYCANVIRSIKSIFSKIKNLFFFCSPQETRYLYRAHGVAPPVSKTPTEQRTKERSHTVEPQTQCSPPKPITDNEVISETTLTQTNRNTSSLSVTPAIEEHSNSPEKMDRRI